MQPASSVKVCQLCTTIAAYHVHLARDRIWEENHAFCETHIHEYIGKHFRKNRDNQIAIDAVTQFDVEMLLHRNDNAQGMLYLKEKGGERRFWFGMGYCECAALYWNLLNTAPFRPGTHKVFGNAIMALGGILQDVTIDGFSNLEHCFHGLIRIQ